MMKSESQKYRVNTTKVSVIGLGKLGLCTAACLADSGYSVLGVDNNPDIIRQVNKGISPHGETGLQDLIVKVKPRLSAKLSEYQTAVLETDITFLVVPTPSTEKGDFSTGYLTDALKPMTMALSETTKPYHLFVIVSTVSPGALMEELVPMMEFHSNRQINHGFGMCYNPEFVALGSVIHDFFNPDLVLIGENHPSDGDILEGVYRNVCRNQPKVARMSIPNAEITKISLNAYVTMKISFVNTLTSLCDNIPGAEIDKITTALGADRRIGGHFLRGGPPFGGPCFPRDNRAFTRFARDQGQHAWLAEATDQVNRTHASIIIDKIDRIANLKKMTIGILGCAYKPGTPVLEESFSIELIDKLVKNKHKVMVYDPLAINNVKEQFGDLVQYADSVESCVTGSDVLVLAVPDPLYSRVGTWLQESSDKIIFDLWRMLIDDDLSSHDYFAFGKYH